MMLAELRQRLLALGYEFAVPEETEEDSAPPEESEILAASEILREDGALLEEETETEEETEETEETPEETETEALALALRRALAEARSFGNKLAWPEVAADLTLAEAAEEIVADWPWAAREAVLDLAAAGFLQAKLAMAPESLAVMPALTSLRFGDAAWSFGGGTQRSGTDAFTRTEVLVAELRRSARAALCPWRALV